MMIKKIAAVWICSLLTVSALIFTDIIVDFIPSTSGTTIYVNETGENGSFSAIQDAIDNASAGDTVFVYNGTYHENLVVNKTINLTGEERNTTIIYGNGSGDVINVTADWVNISCFTIKGMGTGPDNEGVELNDAQNCTVTDVEIIGPSLPLTIILTLDLSLPGDPYLIGLETFPNGTYTIYQPINMSNTTPIFVEVTPVNVSYLSPDFPVSINYTYIHPVLNYTILGEYHFNATNYTIIIENPTYYNISDSVIFRPANVTYADAHITIIEINNTMASPYLIHDIEYILGTRPYTPTNFIARTGYNYINLSWNDQSPDNCFPVKNYIIYKRTASGEESSTVVIGNLTFYNDTNVIPGVTYFYRVRARNAVGEGPLSNEVNAMPISWNIDPDDQYKGQNWVLPWWVWMLWFFMFWVVILAGFVYLVEIRWRKG